ncbi:unnamed protein product [Trifolium pratense]|uniref:Uncharacterized protein n=1 Tax=Trifolium pratense TaxID=57577 RepID=A0ACB0LP33_TRIPR|nr:unnamed protein product [Trifolium pratense]
MDSRAIRYRNNSSARYSFNFGSGAATKGVYMALQKMFGANDLELNTTKALKNLWLNNVPSKLVLSLNHTMAYVKLVLLSVFLLATFVTFPIKKVEAVLCLAICTISTPCAKGCICITSPVGLCLPESYKDAVKIVGKNLICQDDAECKNKKTGNFCVHSPKPDLEYGVCADSMIDAEHLILKIFSKSNLTKGFLEMPIITT